MTSKDVERIRAELLRQYPKAHIIVTDDRAEMIAEIGPGRAVAVIERSLPHFHRKMTEIYRVVRGVLYVACGGQGHVLKSGDAMTIRPGQIHFARGAHQPAWVDVLSEPPWTAEDHLIL